MVSGGHFSKEEQLQILKERYEEVRKITPRWKVGAARKVAAWLAGVVGSKLISDITNFLTDGKMIYNLARNNSLLIMDGIEMLRIGLLSQLYLYFYNLEINNV